MVRYEFLDNQGEWIRYKYFPEDQNTWGIISVNIDSNQGVIDRLAENESIHRIPIGGNHYVDVSSYAGHAINHILNRTNKNEIPQDGIVMWY